MWSHICGSWTYHICDPPWLEEWKGTRSHHLLQWSLVFSFHGSALPRVHWRWIWCLWNMCSPIHTLGIVVWSKQVKVWHVIHIYMWSIQQHSDITCIDVLITSLSSQVTVKIMKETEKIWVGKHISQCKYPYNIICVEDTLLCSPGQTHRREGLYESHSL